jgi:enamine deaminase RidA (YjgF/YER057c/UK114 family)
VRSGLVPFACPARIAFIAFACALAVLAAPQKKKKKEEETQTLQLPRELPGFVTGDPKRFRFLVTPLSAKGLLSAQVRDALKALMRESGSDTVLKIRAFVAGSGDLRRVRDLVSEVFTDRRQPLPVLSLIQSGGLPLEGAQVALEAIVSGKRDVNPDGLAFISAQTAGSENPLDPVAPLAEKSLASLKAAVRAAGAEPEDVLRVTCFLSSLENLAATRKRLEAEYPRAALNYVQTQRAPGQAVASCEAVARARSKIDTALRLMTPEGMAREPGESQIALVAAPVVVLTGTQNSFGYQEQDSRLAFERLRKALEQAGTSLNDVAYTHYYPLSPGIAAQVRKIRGEFFDAANPPAGTLVLFEGLPSMDAGFAVDVVAVKR